MNYLLASTTHSSPAAATTSQLGNDNKTPPPPHVDGSILAVGNYRKGDGGFLDSELLGNPLFTGGIGLMGMGVLLSFGRRLMLLGNAALKRRFISRLELDNSDQAFQWVLDHINRESSRRANQLSVDTALRQTESGKCSASFLFTPGRGQHFFRFKRRWVQVNRERFDKQSIQQSDSTRKALETVSLTTFGADPSFWRSFLENAAKEALAKMESGLLIYVPSGPGWIPFGGVRKRRPLDSVVLDDGVRQRLQTDIECFLNSQKWYTDRGIPYRRGYLFYGPPGTGKSSFISALAAFHGYSICILTLSDRTMDDARLNHLMNNAPPNSFLLLEDIDNAFVRRESAENEQMSRIYEGLSRVTMSGLLNAVDGVASSEGRLLFMTTNFIERLDSALIRPGRVDLKQHFSNCTPTMLEQMFRNFYEVVSEPLPVLFRDRVLATGREYSPAAIQGHLLNHKESPEEAIANVGGIGAAK